MYDKEKNNIRFIASDNDIFRIKRARTRTNPVWKFDEVNQRCPNGIP
jgi:hypothetical protein